MKVVILAAGYGTRLYPLTKETAKPLLPVRAKPIVEYIVDKVSALLDVDKIFIITNHLFYEQFADWLNRFDSTIPIELIDDGSLNHLDRKGAIRDLALAIDEGNIEDDLLVIGGDNLFNFELEDFVQVVLGTKPKILIGTYDLNDQTKLNKFGIVQVDEQKRVIDFIEKPTFYNGSTLVSICLYFFSQEKGQLIAEYLKSGGHADTIGSYIQWLVKNDEVFAFEFKGSWFDIGDINAYNEAQTFFRARIYSKPTKVFHIREEEKR